MTAEPIFSVVSEQAALDAILALFNVGGAGTIEVRTGSVEATTLTADSGTLLATLTLHSTAFAASTDNGAGGATAAANTITSGTAGNTGTAAHFRAKNNAGVVVLQGTVGTSLSDMVLNSVAITSGDTVAVSAWSVTLNGALSLAPVIDGTIVSNISGGTAAPSANSLAAVLAKLVPALGGDLSGTLPDPTIALSGGSFYSAGTFSPTLVGTTTAGSNTYSSQDGNYRKIGSIVFFNILVNVSAFDAASAGSATIAGLPFPADETFFLNSTLSGVTLSSGYTMTVGRVSTASPSAITLIQTGTGLARLNIPITGFATGALIQIEGFYFTANP